MDEEIGTLCSPCSGNRVWTGVWEELTLYSCIPFTYALSVSKSWTEKTKKKE